MWPNISQPKEPAARYPQNLEMRNTTNAQHLNTSIDHWCDIHAQGFKAIRKRLWPTRPVRALHAKQRASFLRQHSSFIFSGLRWQSKRLGANEAGTTDVNQLKLCFYDGMANIAGPLKLESWRTTVPTRQAQTQLQHRVSTRTVKS